MFLEYPGVSKDKTTFVLGVKNTSENHEGEGFAGFIKLNPKITSPK